MIKQTVKKFLATLGYSLQRNTVAVDRVPIPQQEPSGESPDSMLAALSRCERRGLKPNTIIDLGAARGDWTRLARSVWPDKTYIMLEPLNERHADLEEFASSSTSIHFIQSAVGDTNSKQPFIVSDDLDGSGFYDAKLAPNNARIVDVVTLDHIISSLDLKGPYFIKFDTHGHELPILLGASKTLEQCAGIVMECYGFQISSTSKLLWQMCQELSNRGFRLADIVDIMRRPNDEIFWQCDVLFLRDTNSCFERNTYKS